MSSQDTGVNDIGVGALASGAIIDVASAARGLMGHRSKAPSSTSLGGQGIQVVDLVSLNGSNLDKLISLLRKSF